MPEAIEGELLALRERLLNDTVFYAEHCLKILDNRKQLVPLKPFPWQARLERKLEEQRLAGLPQRVLILKARKLGFSTWMQAKLVQRCTQLPYQTALVVAQDMKTAGALFDMGKRMHAHLPGQRALAQMIFGDENRPVPFSVKPMLKGANFSPTGRKYIAFGEPSRRLQLEGSVGLDSTIEIDTAQVAEAGRGYTPSMLHGSEVAWWPDNGKLLGLLNSVPYEDSTFIALESTANGFNHFHKRWVRAEEGTEDPEVGGSYIPFFAAWHEDYRCSRQFPDEETRERFVSSIGTGPYGEDEPNLVETYGCTPEQLYWRRIAIRENAEDSIELFRQEFPSFPEEAFIGSGTPVFSGILVQRVLKAAEDAPEPVRGDVKGMDWVERRTRSGSVLVPQRAIWVPESETATKPGELLHVWEHPVNADTQEGVAVKKPDGQYVVFLDAARGVTHTTEARDYHAIQVIDHESRRQVAEYRSRIDPDEVKVKLLLIARYFNDAWIAVEVTDGIGFSIAVNLARDYRYPKMYRREVAVGARSARTSDRVGWYTDQSTKAMLEETMLEALRDGSHGVQSRRLAREFVTYIEDEKGKHGAQEGEHDDLLIAFMGAKHIATLRRPRKKGSGRKTKFDPITGYMQE